MWQKKLTIDETCLDENLDLSSGQKALFFIHSLGGLAQSAYNESLVYSLKGSVSIDALRNAFLELIKRHEVLRLSFIQNDEGDFKQKLHGTGRLEFNVKEDSCDDSIKEYINAQIKKPFHFDEPTLMRVSIVQTGEKQSILLIVMHHIITDGTSFGVLISDLSEAYNQIVGELSSESMLPSLSYFDHVAAEKERSETAEYHGAVQSFAKSLEGYKKLNFLATPYANEKNDPFLGDRVYFDLNSEICSRIKEYCQIRKVTPFHFLYAAFALFLGKYARSQDVVIGVPFANRRSKDEQRTVGYYVNNIPVRISVKDSDSFESFLSSVKTTIFSCLAKQDLSFEHIAEHLNLEKSNPFSHPMIQAMFVLGSVDKLSLNLNGVTAKQEHVYYAKTSKFDLSLFMLEEGKEKIIAYFEFRTDLFSPELIENLSRSFYALIENILDTPLQQLAMINMLNAREKEHMKTALFQSKLNWRVDKTLNEYFSLSALTHQDNTALIYAGKKYSYRTLESKTNQWASYIRHQYELIYQQKMPRDTLIALCVDRNEDMIFGLLGILKAGAAYVPIDPEYPKERIDYILDHSKAALLLTHHAHDGLALDFLPERTIYMDDPIIESSEAFIDRPHEVMNKPEDIAYVLYTSGSTGRPKGVAVTHENVICLFESLKKQFDLNSTDVWSLFHTFCFDISVWEMWGAFLFGGALLVIPFEVTRDPARFFKLIKSEEVTVLTQTASAFQMFIAEDAKAHEKLKHLRYVAFVGESLKVSILRPWVEKYGTEQPKLANMYGITETTVYTNNKFINQIDLDRGRDNIGWPLEQFSMCVMDQSLQWCPIGFVGEICIGGRGLSRGYLYRDDLTQQKFITDPYSDFLGLPANTKLYLTGDLGRWREDGSIEYLGRKDFQIKLRGFRIELGEIESALGSYPGISHTAVLLKGEGDQAYLAAYYTTEADLKINPDILANHIRNFLPDYMIPKTFMELVSFPMTINGKVDRAKLQVLKDVFSVEKTLVPLETNCQHRIAAIWSDILCLDINAIGVSSNFFDLGGNSLLVIKMLAKVQQQFGSAPHLGQFISVPTLSSLAAFFDEATDIDNASQQLWARLKQDINLEDGILPLQAKNPLIYTPKAILITGATGFLGIHLLAEMLMETDAIIYCLVRAASKEGAMLKLRGQLQKYNLLDSKDLSRIKFILGDLAESNLGMNDIDYKTICDEVDAIFHVGAWVHHIIDYATLYDTNVQSLKACLSLATTSKNKVIHFISTYAVKYISPIERLPKLNDNSFEARLNTNGYLTTKWVSEQLLDQAQSRGIACHIYRPGNIIAGKEGIYEPEKNHTLLRLKGMLQLGKAYVSPQDYIEMMPVDLLSTAIRQAAKSSMHFIYDMNNAVTISWLDYLSNAQKMGWPIVILEDAETWNNLLDSLSEENALYAFSSLYKALRPEDKSSDGIEQINLKPNYIIETPSYDEMVDRQLLSLVKSGFLEPPPKFI
ncbi:MAG: hypothetical protein K0R66_1156 [Gammaproteobacteria bacterium]|nr:hypothetical protein [Gammaproteobacteria bacterium]